VIAGATGVQGQAAWQPDLEIEEAQRLAAERQARLFGTSPNTNRDTPARPQPSANDNTEASKKPAAEPAAQTVEFLQRVLPWARPGEPGFINCIILRPRSMSPVGRPRNISTVGRSTR